MKTRTNKHIKLINGTVEYLTDISELQNVSPQVWGELQTGIYRGSYHVEFVTSKVGVRDISFKVGDVYHELSPYVSDNLSGSIYIYEIFNIRSNNLLRLNNVITADYKYFPIQGYNDIVCKRTTLDVIRPLATAPCLKVNGRDIFIANNVLNLPSRTIGDFIDNEAPIFLANTKKTETLRYTIGGKILLVMSKINDELLRPDYVYNIAGTGAPVEVCPMSEFSWYDESNVSQPLLEIEKQNLELREKQLEITEKEEKKETMMKHLNHSIVIAQEKKGALNKTLNDLNGKARELRANLKAEKASFKSELKFMKDTIREKARDLELAVSANKVSMERLELELSKAELKTTIGRMKLDKEFNQGKISDKVLKNKVKLNQMELETAQALNYINIQHKKKENEMKLKFMQNQQLVEVKQHIMKMDELDAQGKLDLLLHSTKVMQASISKSLLHYEKELTKGKLKIEERKLQLDNQKLDIKFKQEEMNADLEAKKLANKYQQEEREYQKAIEDLKLLKYKHSIAKEKADMVADLDARVYDLDLKRISMKTVETLLSKVTTII